MSEYSELINLVQRCNEIFRDENLEQISIHQKAIVDGYHINKPNEYNLEIRRKTSESDFLDLVVDLYHEELDGDLFYETDTYLDIDFNLFDKVYEEYTSNGELSAILIYGKEILGLSKDSVSNIELLVELYDKKFI